MIDNYRDLSQWFLRCLMFIAILCFGHESVAAHKAESQGRLDAQALLLKIQERDATIASLIARMSVLEQKLGLVPPPVAQQNSPVAGHPSQTAKTETRPEKPQPPSQAQAKTEAPGEFKVDLQASQRALERTLAKTGVLLLPTWFLDSDISFNYAYKESPAGINLTDAQGNPIAAIAPRNRRNTFDPSIGFRLGLPFDAQLEFSLPYRFANQSTVAQNWNGEDKANDSGLGDVQIGFAKTLLKEAQWWPDLVARVAYNTGSGLGGFGNNGLLSQGIESVTGTLSMLKRQDPLVFFFNGGYTKSFTAKNYINGFSFNPGDTLAFSFGTQLAASADTSLSFALNEAFISNSEQDARTIAGSSRNVGVLSIGASSIISRNMFVNLSVGMGLSSDAPDYTAGITFSNRTNLQQYFESAK